MIVTAKQLIVTEELEDDYPPDEHPEEQEMLVQVLEESGARFTRRRLLVVAVGGAAGSRSALAPSTPPCRSAPCCDIAPLSDAVAARAAPRRRARPAVARRRHRGGRLLHRLPRGRRQGRARLTARPRAAAAGRNSACRTARERWAPEGIVAYSKICTHAGCAISLYRAPLFQPTEPKPALVCPCHYSTFDPADGGTVTFGPAGRRCRSCRSRSTATATSARAATSTLPSGRRGGASA